MADFEAPPILTVVAVAGPACRVAHQVRHPSRGEPRGEPVVTDCGVALLVVQDDDQPDGTGDADCLEEQPCVKDLVTDAESFHVQHAADEEEGEHGENRGDEGGEASDANGEVEGEVGRRPGGYEEGLGPEEAAWGVSKRFESTLQVVSERASV